MSQQIDDGGPAFPVAGGCVSSPGMSLRDWFAGQALVGILSDPDNTWNHKHNAQQAYKAADAMLAARLTKPE